MSLNAYEQPVPRNKISYSGAGALAIPSGKEVWCIIPETPTTFDASTDASASSASNTAFLANLHPAGVPIWGKWTALSVAAGTGNVYYA